jgi:hypothetical protein
MLLGMPTAALAQTNYNTSPSAQTGQQVYGSYFGADIDAVNLYNGNLNLNIPLFSLPGRELPVGISLSYNTGQWEQTLCGSDPCGYYTGGWKIATTFPDESLSFYRQPLSCVYVYASLQYKWSFMMNVYWTDGLGTRHRYGQIAYGPGHSSQCLYNPPSFDYLSIKSMDSDGSILSTGSYNTYTGADPAYITFRDGTIKYFKNAWTSNAPSYDLITLNGNYLVAGSNNLPTQDTLGRCARFGNRLPSALGVLRISLTGRRSAGAVASRTIAE